MHLYAVIFLLITGILIAITFLIHKMRKEIAELRMQVMGLTQKSN